MTLRTIIAISLIVSVTTGLFVGCGDGDDPAGAEQIDKAAFVRQANLVCERSSGTIAAKFASITQRESSKPDYDFVATQVVVVKQALIPGLEEQMREIRALGVPEEGRKEAEVFLAAYQRAIAKIRANPKAAATNATPPYEAIELAGTRFGVTECPVVQVIPN